MRKLQITICLFLVSFALKAQEYKYHPIFIYNFSKYIEWPASASEGDFVISVVGNSNAYQEMLNISERKKTIKNQNLVVKKCNSINDIGKSNIVFVTKGKNITAEDIRRMGEQGMLVITEHDDMAQKGSHINFIATHDSKIGFELNTTMAQQSGLKVASSLAGLAAKTY